MSEIPNKKKTAKIRVYVDLFFFTLMILVLIPQSTGIPIHEWASFIILAPFFFHLIINWNWIVTNSSKFFKRKPNKTRFDYVLNWLMYLLMIIVTISGIVISESVLPLFGIHFQPDMFWSRTHDISATLFMVIFGIHITLHWRWIVSAIRNLKFKSDLHHLTELSAIIKKRSKQLLLLAVVSIILSFAFWMFDYTDWADGFRINTETGEGGKSKRMPEKWMIYVLPLLKVTILISIPALISGGIIKLKKRLA